MHYKTHILYAAHLNPLTLPTIQLSFYIDQTMMKLTHSRLTPSGPIHAHEPLQKLNFF